MTNAEKKPRKPRGRPIGSSTALTRFELNKVAKSGRSPIDIMLKNMWWWDEQADALGDQIQSALKDLAEETNDDKKVEEIEKLKNKLDAFVNARFRAQSCAVDAAPFCHAKLQSIAIKANNGKKVIEVETIIPSSSLSLPSEAVDVAIEAAVGLEPDRSYRNGYNSSSVVPLRKKA